MTEEQDKNGIDQVLSSISLASVLNGFKSYRDTWKIVLQCQGGIVSITAAEPNSFTLRSAFSTFLYGVALCFVLYIPVIVQNRLELDKIYFLIQFLYLQCILVLVVYLSAKIFLGRGTLKKTAASYLVFVGVFAPTLMFIDYPLFLYMPVADFVGFPSRSQEMPNLILTIPTWVQIWNGIVFILMLTILFRVLLRWIAEVHQISRRRLIASMCFVYFPIMFLHNTFVAPYVAKGIQLFSEMLGKLV